MVITSTVYWKFRQSLVSQATLQPLIMCADSLLICFIAVEIVKTNLNTPIWKAWGSASRAQRPLPTGIVRQIPVVKGAPRDVTKGGARETALASSTYAPFTWRLLTFKGWNWKCHVIIVIKTDLSGFVVPVHSGLCEQYVKSLGLRPRDLTSCFARALVHWDNKPLQNRS